MRVMHVFPSNHSGFSCAIVWLPNISPYLLLVMDSFSGPLACGGRGEVAQCLGMCVYRPVFPNSLAGSERQLSGSPFRLSLHVTNYQGFSHLGVEE